jgi:hypothetical protein
MSLEDMTGTADASTLGTPYASASQAVTLANSHIKQRFNLQLDWTNMQVRLSHPHHWISPE